jgi:hypothetical protein
MALAAPSHEGGRFRRELANEVVWGDALFVKASSPGLSLALGGGSAGVAE